jgi:hypothetical protein
MRWLRVPAPPTFFRWLRFRLCAPQVPDPGSLDSGLPQVVLGRFLGRTLDEHSKRYPSVDRRTCVAAAPPLPLWSATGSGAAVRGQERLIFYVMDVDGLGIHLSERRFDPGIPQDASWRERYFHVPDPDGYELSFARPLE